MENLFEAQFYNTIDETGDKLAKSKKQVSRQGQVVLSFFRYYQRSFSPSDVHRFILKDCPLTSIRRAITDLTNLGYLVKLNRMKKGPYGKNEHLWELNNHEKTGKKARCQKEESQEEAADPLLFR